MIVIYYQDKITKETLTTGVARCYFPTDSLKEFRFFYDKEYYSWLGVK